MKNTSYTREIIALEPNLDIGFAEVTADMVHPYTPFHWHDSYELIYIVSGSATFQKMSQGIFTCFAGDIICTEPYEIHDMRSTPDTHFIIAMIPTSFIRKYIPDLNQTYFELPPSRITPIIQTKVNYLQKTFYDLLVARTFRERGYLLRFQSLLFELLYQLYHNFSVPLVIEKTEKSAKNYQRLQNIVTYVHENYQKQISINEIADRVYLQPHYFCHYFKNNFGQSFLNYMYEIRLYHIESDLIHTNLSIGYIAEKHGFISLDLFRKKFYQKNKCTPVAYRKKHKVLID